MTEKEIIEAIQKIENEQERRKKLPINNYNTGEKKHLKQIAFHKCLKRNRWVFGGNRSGKTECGAVEAIYMARGILLTARTEKTFSGGWCRCRARCRGTWRRAK